MPERLSKYIGETEKNLWQIFGRAEGRDVVLLFAEEDAFFGKRAGVGEDCDCYADLKADGLPLTPLPQPLPPREVKIG